MGDIVKMFTGGSGIAKQQQAEAAKAERRSLAAAAQQQGELDQAKSAGNRKRGRRLLTFLSGDGQDTLG
jgi:hypothetical protein